MSTSNTPADKLRAAITQSRPDIDRTVQPDYLRACKGWWDQLSSFDMVTATKAAEAFSQRDLPRAEKLAAALPDAPQRPPREH